MSNTNEEVTTTTPEVGTEAQTEANTPEVIVKQNEGSITVETKPVDPMAPPEAESETEEKPNEGDTDTNIETDISNQQKAEEDIKKDLDSKGVNFDDLQKEFDAKGELSEDSLKSLEKAGYPKSVVDAYINGLQAITDRFVSSVKQMAGGEEGYKQLASFIQTQPKSTVDAFNTAIQTGNLGQIQLAISGLKAQMVSKYGTSNPTIMAGAGGRGTVTGYTTTAQMVKDMSDPRYQKDPAFTREVMLKVKNSTIF